MGSRDCSSPWCSSTPRPPPRSRGSSKAAGCRRTARARFWRHRCPSTRRGSWPISSSTTAARARRRAGRWVRSGRASLSSALDADLAQDLVVVLAETWSPTPARSLEQSACSDLRVRRDLVEVEDRLAAHVEVRENRLPLAARLRLEDQLHRTLHLRRRGVLRLDQVGASKRQAYRRPEFRLQR